MQFQNLPNLVDVRNQLTTHPNRSYGRHRLEQISYITVHHSATTSGNAQSFANYHVNFNNWPGIGYHFVILRDGAIQWTNDLQTTSFHTGGRNTGNIGICLVGSGQFTDEQLERLVTLIVHLRMDLSVPVRRVLGHNEHPDQTTACPSLNMDRIRNQVEAGRTTAPAPGDTVEPEGNGGEDMPVNLPTRTLRRGDHGEQVRRLQNALMQAGVNLPQFGADGIFGQETERAVRRFQREHGLTIDGIAGPETYQRLREVLTNASDTIHRVQVGAFSERENAESLARELRELGYDVVIKST
ncbi:N-acetyl-anhydromuramyl-L-alanine amidase AmpD [Evansella vedderi]|uniref:Autolysin n=1 Tax=Evansella vedderi TaxID=38282 RepID=A0ABU0A0J0_9BACI|nr:N-acetylmuramoyl-L-alanine amidase [Evansella vedderi]MDQ0257008.1 N-acetyl-anhydromuramyl-L-alanine amidase AmpD [Evansella vedderi]